VDKRFISEVYPRRSVGVIYFSESGGTQGSEMSFMTKSSVNASFCTMIRSVHIRNGSRNRNAHGLTKFMIDTFKAIAQGIEVTLGILE
jgi:hypothetical protein